MRPEAIVVECVPHRETVELGYFRGTPGFWGVVEDAIVHPVLSWRLLRFVFRHNEIWCEIIVHELDNA